MNRRKFLQTGSVLLAPRLGQPSPENDRPNILVLFADQFRLDCLGANGNRIIKTPNLDRLASGAANFSNAYVQAAVCVPSRISYLTGRYPHSHKNRVNYTPCDSREVMMQQLLHASGYQTGSLGKLHFYPPTADHARSMGFDRVFLDDGVRSTDPYSDYVRWRKEHDPNSEVSYEATAKDIQPGKNPYRLAGRYEFSPTFWTGMQTVQVLREFAASSRPFFLYSSFFKPHAPYAVPVPYDTMYDGVEIPLPKAITLDDIHKLPLPVQKEIGRSHAYDINNRVRDYEIDRVRLEWIYRNYYASVSMVDHEMGLILDELERSGKAENTIIVFATDHGDQLGEHGLEGKNVLFEASVHVPIMVRCPKRVVAGKYHQLIEAVDILPTLLDLCGLPVPEKVQGCSLAPLITGNPDSYTPREAVFCENIIPEVLAQPSLKGTSKYWPFVPGQGVEGILHPDAKMVRTKRWKLNYYPTCEGELYDLENDPGETRNLWSDPSHADLVRTLKDTILNWLVTADQNDQIAPYWLV
jgi:arylsulfatase A-like enzyme